MIRPRRRPARPAMLVAVDVVVAVGAMAVSWVILWGSRADWPTDSRHPDVVAAVLIVVVNATIAWRRRAVEAALVVALVAGTVYAARHYPPTATPAVLLIVYTAATTLDTRRSRLVLIVAVAATWLATTVAAGATEVAGVVYVAGSWLLGHYVRTRRLLVAELEQRAADLERQREEQAARAVAEERLRIARELHDILAHTMSVVAVQAGTGRLVGADHPDDAIEALAAVETTARSAMHELRQILTVLRAEDNQSVSIAPAAGLDEVPALIAQVIEAGIDVDMRVEGQPRAVPAGVSLAAYRITQEALTNVIKHAGRARVSVLLRYTDHDITVEVRDDGRATVPFPGAGGHGLAGMRERVAVHGGELTAGPDPHGGFIVRARLPVRPESA